jgi:DNA-3-methyladenine glycosylase
MGRTERNAPMWGPPGRAYVYLCYGVHSMLNLVTNAEGEGAAVLIRAVEAIDGVATIERRRGRRIGARDLAGPGKVAQALDLDTSWSGRSVVARGGLECRFGERVERALVGPRVGIDYASARDRRAPYRFADPASTSVSERRTLRLERRRAA